VAPDIAIVIPTYNEAVNLPIIVAELRKAFACALIVVVDDNSPDGTGDIADSLQQTSPPLSVLHRPAKEGIGPAYKAGFDTALESGASLIVAMDADGSHAVSDLAALIEASRHADLVVGSRYVDGGTTIGWPYHRRILSRFGGIYARTVLGMPISDLTSGFKVYKREVLERIPLDAVQSDGYGFQIETTWYVWKLGGRVVEVPITFYDRVAGKSKLSRRIVLEAMTMVWQLRFRRYQPVPRD
jgi:dolichol-phosphate mannosyltransferase